MVCDWVDISDKLKYHLQPVFIKCYTWEIVTTTIDIPSNQCNYDWVYSFDLSLLPDVETVSIGSNSYKKVTDVKIDGLRKLKWISIGEKSFTDMETYSSYSFVLKNCPEITSLFINNHAFSTYGSCTIENNSKMTSLTIGGSHIDYSYSFYYANLMLRSTREGVASPVDMDSLSTATFGTYAFYDCMHVTFESISFCVRSHADLPKLQRIKLLYRAFYYYSDKEYSSLTLKGV